MIRDRSTAKVVRRRRLMRSRLISLVHHHRVAAADLPVATGRSAGRRLLHHVAPWCWACRWRSSASLSSCTSWPNGKLRTLGSGIAIRIGPPGIQVAGLGASWSEVAAIDTVKGGLSREPRLRLTTADGRRADVPFDQVTVFPATLDSTVRAFSAGRHGVDLSALES